MNVLATWKERHLQEWRERGHAYSAVVYAGVVIEHRSGLRDSLSFNFDLGWGRKTNNQARALLRREIDDILKESRSMSTVPNTAFERHYEGYHADAVVDLRETVPANNPEISTHRHVVVQWHGGEVWLDMSEQGDHFCIDVRQFNPDDEMKGQGVFTIVNGHRQSFGEAVRPVGSGETLNEVYKNTALEDTNGTPVTGKGWNGGYVVTLLTDLHGQEAAAVLPSSGNG